MNDPYDPRFLGWSKSFSKYVALIVLGIAAIVLISWELNLPSVQNSDPGQFMQVDSAIAFIFSGIALWLANMEKRNPSSLFGLRTVAALVALLGVSALAETIFGGSLSHDRLMLNDVFRYVEFFQRRMSMASAINFSLISFALMLLDSRIGRAYPPAQPITVLAGFNASIAMVGHLFEDASLHTVSIFSSISFLSSASFLLLVAGILCARPYRGMVGLLCSNTYGGRAFRRLLPFTLSIPFLLGWLGTLGKHGQFYDGGFDAILLVTTMSLLLSLTAWLTSAWLHRLDLERRQAYEKLQTSEQRFRALIENSSDQISILSADGTLIYESPSLYPPLGYRPNQFLGQNLFELIHPADLERVQNEFLQLVQDASLHPRDQFRLHAKDGSWLWVEAVATNLLHEPSVGGIVINYHDITDRRQAEEKLLQSQRVLAEAQQVAKIGSWSFDSNTQAVSWSDELYRIFGVEPETFHGNYGAFADRIHPCDQLRVQQVNAEALATGQPFNIEYRIVTPSGEVKTIAEIGHAITDQEGKVTGLFGVAQDITERKQAEEALRAAELQFRLLVENIPAVTYTVSEKPPHPTLYISPQVQPILGFTPEEWMADPMLWEKQLHPEDRARILALSEECVRTGHQFDAEYRIVSRDGRVVWLHEKSLRAPGAASQPGFSQGVEFDITERKQTQERIERQLQRFEALHAIDLAITSSLDLRLTLAVVLKQTTTQLGVDAANVLLYDANTQMLTYGAGYGFRTHLAERRHIRPGDGPAGACLLERRTIHERYPARGTATNSTSILTDEGFIEYYVTPLIAKATVIGVLEIFHRTPFEADDEWMLFLETLAGQTAIAVDSAHLFERLQRSNQDLLLAYDTTIEGWSRALDLRDKETEGHTQRVTNLTLELARSMNISDTELGHIRRGALLHDIGKMGVPDHILLKPSQLTEEEWAIMRQHPTFANDLLSQIDYLRPALDIPYCHHEKWDGSGYPRGLKGEDIPLAARVFSIIDVYDALTSDRPYRKGWTKEKTLEHIYGQSGTHFDPHVVEAFIRIMKEKE